MKLQLKINELAPTAQYLCTEIYNNLDESKSLVKVIFYNNHYYITKGHHYAFKLKRQKHEEIEVELDTSPIDIRLMNKLIEEADYLNNKSIDCFNKRFLATIDDYDIIWKNHMNYLIENLDTPLYMINVKPNLRVREIVLNEFIKVFNRYKAKDPSYTIKKLQKEFKLNLDNGNIYFIEKYSDDTWENIGDIIYSDDLFKFTLTEDIDTDEIKKIIMKKPGN